MNITWTPQSAIKWQQFYNSAARLIKYGGLGHVEYENMDTLPKYEDLKSEQCKKQ
jgi:hypothetical protein